MGLINYFNETQAELKHVSWPTRLQTTIFTLLVIVLSLATAAYLGVFDALFASIITHFFTK